MVPAAVIECTGNGWIPRPFRHQKYFKPSVPWMKAPVSQTAIVIEDRSPDRSESWRWGLAAGLLVIVLAIPFVLVDVPPVLDYPNHLARYFVLAHPDDPFLSQMFAPHWGILPNQGMDIVGALLL